jgi:IS30 family transposase
MVLSPRSACLLTHVDRKTKYTLIDLLENHEKETIRKQTIKSFKNINVRSITYDNGIEFNDYELTERKLDINIYFADTYASYQRGTNENTNGLIRD